MIKGGYLNLKTENDINVVKGNNKAKKLKRNSKEKRKGGDMESQAPNKSRFVMIEPRQSWDFYVTAWIGSVKKLDWRFYKGIKPSVAMNPIFEDLASAYPDVLFLTVDVDGVRVRKWRRRKAMPAPVLVKDGAQVDKIVSGCRSRRDWKRTDSFFQSIPAYIALSL
ncbi:hypothetical protein DKX38_016980 [Salix brachista]|uniref:Thioredoxin-like fold domain-containing protein n=1 Tax=Salix brachista TaxID=2182728 RepID=A0A5N5KU03_9ROSI|nr:hypothetical protein DKX38_016922 [Salix brachista]KAB5533894.1 hypothetical protein DKX38_016980 [Salix brachista]